MSLVQNQNPSKMVVVPTTGSGKMVVVPTSSKMVVVPTTGKMVVVPTGSGVASNSLSQAAQADPVGAANGNSSQGVSAGGFALRSLLGPAGLC